jgi:hypothetical protein
VYKEKAFEKRNLAKKAIGSKGEGEGDETKGEHERSSLYL